jgi:MoaA/NifB/PqqE/SkfB family radical SAM enzyme
VPSLRYLELQVTWRCNLACAHCYLGPARGVDLPVPLIAALARSSRPWAACACS